MKFIVAAFMLFILAHSIYLFWHHDLIGFSTSLATFLVMRFALQQIKNDHSQSE